MVRLQTDRRPYHHGNLPEALLRAAEAALEARGSSMLSLRELSRVVGVSHTSPRRHFADKQALLDALARTGFQRLDATLARVAKGVGAISARSSPRRLRPTWGSR